MKKGLTGALALMLVAAMLSGCGKAGDPDKGDGADGESGSAASTTECVTVGEYKGLEVNIPAMGKDELEAATAEYFFNALAVADRKQITDRPVKKYDMTNIDYEGKKDGVAFSGGTAQGSDLLIGSGRFIEGFEDGLIGVMPGETVDLPLRFPDNYGNTELAGQEVVFTVKVNYIAEMNDEQAASMGIENVSNLEQLRQYIEDRNYRETAETTLFDRILETAVFGELPEDKLLESRKIYAAWIEQMAAMYGMDATSFMEAQGMDYESLLQQYAEAYTKQQLVLEVIAAKEGLELTEEALDKRISELAESEGVTVEELVQMSTSRENLRANFLYEDVMRFLVDNAVNTAK